MALELASTYISVGLNADGLQKAIQKDFSAAGKDASKSFGRGFNPEKESRGPLGKLGKGLLNVGKVGAGAVGLIGAAVGGLALHGGIDRALNIEKAQAKLKGLGHDTKSVDAIMKNALASVKGTAFGMGEAATTAAGAVAAGIKPGQDLERMLKGVANSAAAAGIGMDEMGSIWNKVATSDMAQMDVLNQVADRGIPIYQALAEEMGVTAGEVRKLASSGKVDFATFEKAMTNASGTVAKEMGNTVTGKLDNAKAALSRLGETAVSQFMPMFSSGLDVATTKIDELGPAVESASKWVADGFRRISDIAKGVGSTLFEGAGRVSDLFSQRVLPVFGSVWTLIKENVAPIFGTLADVLSRTLLPILSDIVNAFTKHILPTLVTFVGYIVKNVLPTVYDFAHKILKPAFELVGSVITGFWNNIGKPVFRALWWTLTEVVGPAVKWLWEKVFSPVFTWIGNVVSKAWSDYIKPALSALQGFIDNVLGPTVTWLWRNIFKPAFDGIGKAVDWAWRNAIKPAFDGIKRVIDNVVAPAIRWLNDKVFTPIFKTLGETVDKFGRTWSRVWDGIKSATAKPINAVIRFINTGLVGGFNFVAEKVGIKTRLGKLSTISGYARGGILPGQSRYSDGDDQLIMARRGEGIVVSEALRDPYERERLLALNKAALQGIPLDEFRAHYDGFARGGMVEGFANGGIVSYKGKRFTAIFAAALRAAEQAAGHSFRITQGGFRPRTSYSGTSHAGDAVDIGRPFNTRSIAALRRHGIAAWDRTGKGNWIPHIHGVPLPGYGRAAGSAVWQAQDYLRGGDGLGGRDNGPRGANIIGGLKGLAAAFQSGFESIKDWFGDIWGKVTGPFKTFQGAVSGGNFLGEIATAIAGKLKDGLETWTKEKIGFGKGYLNGGIVSTSGPAWLSEDGRPELVVGPQVRNMQAGSRVYSFDETRKLLHGSKGDTHITIKSTVNNPVAEPTSVREKRLLDHAAALGLAA